MNRNLTKRIMGLLLALVLLISNVPATAVVAETFAPTEAEELVPKNTAERVANSSAYGEGTIYPTLNATQKNIEQQIRSYAKSLNYSGADGDAAWELAMHGITGRGKHLKLSGNHGLTAALMNSEMGLSTVIRGCIMGISVMQHNGLSSAVNDAGCNYDTKLPIYYTCIYPDDSFDKDRRLYDADACLYTGPLNAYDKSLMWISGSTEFHMYFTRGTVTADNITYNVTVNFEDRFDFNSDSSSVPEKIASLIGSFLFRGFDWTATAKFQVTVPNLCTHQSNSYHWVYDASKQQLTTDASNGFDQNSVQKFSYRFLYATDNTYRTFYHINQAIHLRHDRPWVMEYMTSDPDTLILSGSNIQNTVNPYFYYASRMQYLFIPIMKRLSDGTAHTDYYGVPLNRKFQYKAGDSYSVRLENVLEDDGSNTIYLTVYNNTTQETVLEPTPMNDRYVKENSSYVLKTSDSDDLAGMDFVIDYIGNRYYTFEPTSFDLKIWENGVDGGKGDYFTSKVTKPTCTARGYTTNTCALCGYSYKDTYVAALGHSYGDWVQKTPPTCTAQGEEQRTCKTCKGTETRNIAPNSHSYDVVVTPPTCTEQGYTTHKCECGNSYVDTYVDATGHSYGDWYTTEAPTENAQGEKRRDCSDCDAYETSTLAALDHDHYRWETIILEAKLPTCTVSGLTEGSKCSKCGEILVPQNTVPATGHTYGEWLVTVAPTCTEKGEEKRECDNCNHFETRELEKIAHTYTAVVTKPTCTAQGYTTHTCFCGESYVDTYTEATGHSFGEWYTTKAPTCTAKGEEKRECDNCDHFETKVVDKVAHNYVSTVTKPSCTEKGYTTHTCKCGDSYIDTYTDAIGHSFTNYVSDGNATLEADGTKTALCDHGCGAKDTVTDEGSKLEFNDITSDIYEVKDGFISGISIKTTVKELKESVNETEYVRVVKDGKLVEDKAVLGTGMKIQLMNGSEVLKEITVVVTGDTNGDGNISVTDMISVKAHILKKSTLTDAYSEAGDTNGDGGISITDFIQIKAHILGKSSLE